ncbi:MAG: hypothetical protein PQJ46_08230 [Spirochaetales bacterium]|nr:hypothetical protein [Spirochaetales bacterium]
MKKLSLLLIFLLFMSFSVSAIEQGDFSIGVSFAAGGRYDNVRMCVASPAGFPGGFAMEPAGLVLEYGVTDNFGIGAYIPLGRPLIFALNTQMLQFLPELVFSIHVPITDTLDFVLHPALGASLHYGPDYLSDADNRGEDFFAAGPRVSLLGGVEIKHSSGQEFVFGLKPYFEYLFSDYRSGYVIGGEFDFQYRYNIKSDA